MSLHDPPQGSPVPLTHDRRSKRWDRARDVEQRPFLVIHQHMAALCVAATFFAGGMLGFLVGVLALT